LPFPGSIAAVVRSNGTIYQQRSLLILYCRLILQLQKALTTWLDPGLTILLDANGSPDGFAAPSFFFPLSVESSAMVNTPPSTDFGSIVTKSFQVQEKFRLTLA
jgi:hypothetical protein